MKVYQLHISPGENDADGKNFDEWFSSLRAARKRRAELIFEAERPESETPKYVSDFKITRYEVADVPLKQLVLALLNRRHWAKPGSVLDVVPDYNIGCRRSA